MEKLLFPLYSQKLIDRARWLRKNSTSSEVLLWEKIKGRQIYNYKFRRQTPILKYIVDFYCKELSLAIEIDGLSHDYKMKYDFIRQKDLENAGVSLLRFNDLEVKQDIQNVLQRISDWIEANPPLPRPSGE
ncbi:MAG TPA: endonuclease domain-containing protein [Candidatus Udaeobacter sp.]|nr:endonuclease domain-containing protein [Candidatus Udaeobacter sp.]